MSEHATPFDLIASIRRERGAEVGPPPMGYQDNRSLEARDGEAPPAHPMMDFPPPPPAPRPTPAPLPLPPPNAFDDTIHLMAKNGMLGGHRFALSDADVKAIKAVVIKAIRRELRELEKA